MRPYLKRLFCAALLFFPLICADAAETIPYVGCPGTNGADGPGVEAAAQGAPVSVTLPPQLASFVASYAGPYGPGLIAPRGWHCFYEVSGDGNYDILVTPTKDNLLAYENSTTGTSSPGISYSYWDGGTGGRDMVIPLQVFFSKKKPGDSEDLPPNDPKEGIDLDAIPPDPDDVISDKSHDMLQFMTPAYHDGLGTWLPWLFRKSPLPIYGIVHVDWTGDTDAELFQIRLPNNLSFLRRTILEHIEAQVKSEGGA